MVTALICVSWACLIVWGVSASSRGGVYWAVVSFVLSQTVYVPAIGEFLARATGAPGLCNQFMNVWGLISAFAVIAFLVARHRATRFAILLAGGFAAAALMVLAYAESPSPVGCISTLPDVSSASPYWWTKILTHVASSCLALVVLLRAAQRSRRGDRTLAGGLLVFGLAFGSSTLFWVMQGVTLVDRGNQLGTIASESVFPATVVLTTAALIVTAIDQAAALVRTRREVDLLWDRWVTQEQALNPGHELPTRKDVVGSWATTPAESVHQLRMQVADNDLILASRARTTDSAN